MLIGFCDTASREFILPVEICIIHVPWSELASTRVFGLTLYVLCILWHKKFLKILTHNTDSAHPDQKTQTPQNSP